MNKNKIVVTSDNIFPIIKKFLYSDQDIFLRELVSNATDAIIKLKTISRIENINFDNLKIEIIINKSNNEIRIIDNGIGMTKNEIEKYINQIAFSGAEEFIKKYKENSPPIIGHFGLGFYSSFIVSKKVMILTKSYKKDFPSMSWSCEGSPNFSMKEIEKKDRGTEIVLFLNEENKEFLEYDCILKLLKKYCKFMPVPIYLKNIGDRGKNNKKEALLINNVHPAWKKKPSQLKKEEYLKFYKELYPSQIEDPLFWVHLNIDHPFYLTGILFFPRIENKVDIQREKIHLYQNQVYVTDNLEGIVPDFLSLLKGVIDSPDIPLNVSRSHLQFDKSVKNISKYITRKVADKLYFLFKNNRKDFNKKWENIKIIIEYGIISDDNFFKKVSSFFILNTVDQEFFTLEEFKNKVKDKQKNKEGKIIFIYSSNKEEQYDLIQQSKAKNYKVLFFDSPLSVHLIQKLEFFDKEIQFVRIDSDHINKLIISNNNKKNNLLNISDDEKKYLEKFVKDQLNFIKCKMSIKLENSLSENDNPFLIIIPEFLRRMKEMSLLRNEENQNFKNFDNYNLIINTNNKLIRKILQEVNKEKKDLILRDMLMLTLLSKNLLKGKNLHHFISKKINELY